MATTLPISINDAELATKWTEQYVSQALNRHMRGFGGHGVVRGFIVDVNASDRTLVLNLDPITGDSVMIAGGRDGTNNDDAITYRITAPLTLDLSAYVLTTDAFYTLAFYPNYVQGSATAPEWRLYSDAEVAAGDVETDNAVVVCRVQAPSSFPNPFAPERVFVATRDDLWKWQSAQGAMATPSVVTDRTYANYLAIKAAFTANGIYNTDLSIAISTDAAAPFPDKYANMTSIAVFGYTNVAFVSDLFEVREGDRIVMWFATKNTAGMTVTPRILLENEEADVEVTEDLATLTSDGNWNIDVREYYVGVGTSANKYLAQITLRMTPGNIFESAGLNRVYAVVKRSAAPVLSGTKYAGFLDRADRADQIDRNFRTIMVSPQNDGDGPWRLYSSVNSVLNFIPPIIDAPSTPFVNISSELNVSRVTRAGTGLLGSDETKLLVRSDAGSLANAREIYTTFQDIDQNYTLNTYYNGTDETFELVAGATWSDAGNQWTSQYGINTWIPKLTFDPGKGTLDLYFAAVSGSTTFTDADWLLAHSFSGRFDGVAASNSNLAEPVLNVDAPQNDATDTMKKVFEFAGNAASDRSKVNVYAGDGTTVLSRGLFFTGNAT